MEAEDVTEALRLLRKVHIDYIHSGLGTLPSGFASLGASRPWIVYWITHSLALLGADLPTAGPSANDVVDFLKCVTRAQSTRHRLTRPCLTADGPCSVLSMRGGLAALQAVPGGGGRLRRRPAADPAPRAHLRGSSSARVPRHALSATSSEQARHGQIPSEPRTAQGQRRGLQHTPRYACHA